MEIIAERKDDSVSVDACFHLPMQSQIALMFMAVMVIFSVFASLLNSWIITGNFESELDEEAAQYIHFIFNGYKEHPENLNTTKFRRNLNAIVDDEYVIFISLHNKNHDVIFSSNLKGDAHASIVSETEFAANTTSIKTVNNIRYYNHYVQAHDVSEGKGSFSALSHIIIGLDNKVVFSTALNAFVWTFLIAILASICMMFVGVIIIKKFTKPFDQLSDAMTYAQSGERGVRVEPDGANEIYKMGIAFNAMISVLEKREDRLLTQKKSLEDEIKERKSAELAVKDSTLRLRAIFNNAVDGIVVVNKQHEITSINPSAEKIYGYEEGELIGEAFTKVMHSLFIRMTFGVCDKDIAPGKTEYKTTAITSSGDKIPVEVSVSKMRVSKDEDYLVVIRDISERIKYEQELNNYRLHLENMVDEQTRDIARSRDAAMAGEKAMSTFLSNMSHELRTPLHGVLSFTNIALKRISVTNIEKTKDYLGEIRVCGQNLLDIINDLLDLSKMKSGKMDYHYALKDFVNIANNVTRELKQLAKAKGIKFVLDVQGKEVDVEIDEMRIMQVLRNLYANAVKFSDESENIHSTVDFKNPGYMVFSIYNSGVCVPDSEHEIIFESFSQSSNTTTNAGGTGLGLSITKEIIEVGHCGTIFSEKGIKNGAKFVIKMPLAITKNIFIDNDTYVREVKNR